MVLRQRFFHVLGSGQGKSFFVVLQNALFKFSKVFRRFAASGGFERKDLPSPVQRFFLVFQPSRQAQNPESVLWPLLGRVFFTFSGNVFFTFCPSSQPAKKTIKKRSQSFILN